MMDKKLIRQASENLELMDISVTQQSLTTDKSAYSFGSISSDSNMQQMRRRSEITIVDYGSEETEMVAVVVDVEFATRLIDKPVDASASPHEEGEDEDHYEDGDEAAVLVEMQATIRIEYIVSGVLPSEAALQEFANFNAVHNAYPFWREIVFSMAKSAQTPPVFVPLYHDGVTGHAAGGVQRATSVSAETSQKGSKLSKNRKPPKSLVDDI